MWEVSVPSEQFFCTSEDLKIIEERKEYIPFILVSFSFKPFTFWGVLIIYFILCLSSAIKDLDLKHQ